MADLKLYGIRRDGDGNDGNSLVLTFNRAPTDDEMRSIHDRARQDGSAAQAVEPKRRDIFAICDAYESGIGHGLQRDGHKSGAIFGNPECGMAYEIGYEEGEERASGKKPNAPPVAAEQPAAAGIALTDEVRKLAEEMLVSNRPHHREFKVANALLTIAAHTRAAGQDGKDGERIARAYGYLWHVNAGKDAPAEVAPLSLSPETAAYAARHILRDMLTHEQRGKGIDAARAAMQAKSAQGGGNA